MEKLLVLGRKLDRLQLQAIKGGNTGVLHVIGATAQVVATQARECEKLLEEANNLSGDNIQKSAHIQRWQSFKCSDYFQAINQAK